MELKVRTELLEDLEDLEASFQMEEVEVEDHLDHLEEAVEGEPLNLGVEAAVVVRPTLVEVVEGEEPPLDQGELVVGEVPASQ